MVGPRKLEKGKTFVPAERGRLFKKSTAIAYAQDRREDDNQLARVVPGRDGGYHVYVGGDRDARVVRSIDTGAKELPPPRTMSGSQYRKGIQEALNRMNKPSKSKQTELAERYRRLRRYSFIVACVHLAAGLFMIALANTDFTIGITSTFSAGPPGCAEAAVDPCERVVVKNFDAVLAYCVAGFSLLSAFFHFLTVSPWFFESYVNNLERGRNPYRWVEYSLSSTLMILIIMLVAGVSNLAALIAAAFANASMILFGWISEIMNPPERDRTDFTAFWFGCIAGLGAWAALYGALFINLAQLDVPLSAIPLFVWVIIATQFTLFNIFALNHYLQFRGVFVKDYLEGERNYITLSLIAKSLLAWSLYVNTLIL